MLWSKYLSKLFLGRNRMSEKETRCERFYHFGHVLSRIDTTWTILSRVRHGFRPRASPAEQQLEDEGYQRL